MNCDYVVSNEWNTGFVAEVRLTNTGDDLIEDWQVNWEYTDGSSIGSSWNAEIVGSGPYSATGVGWNRVITPGQTVAFGVQGIKGGDSAPIVQLSGEGCN